MSLSKGLSAASLLVKRPAGWLKVALERAKDEGRKTKDEKLFRSDVVANRIS